MWLVVANFLLGQFVFAAVQVGHVWMWELDCEESWTPKNWCFWTVVLEKTLESPLDCKEIQLVHSTGDQPWVFCGRNDAKAKTPVLWPPHVKSWLIGKVWGASSARGKGHEEGGLTYAKAGSSLRSPPGNSRASTPKIRVCLLSALCFHLHLWLYGGLSPTTSLKKELAYSSS